MYTLRFATPEDAKDLLRIYAQYIDTKTTFEDKMPSFDEFEKRISEIQRYTLIWSVR